jgi:hypothetical protein
MPRHSSSFAFAFVSLLAIVPAQTVLIAHTLTSQWSTGFQGRITILNQAPWTIYDWRLGFDAGYTITSMWNAQIATATGAHYEVTAVQASWEDGDLSPNEMASIDFVATGVPTLPTNGTLNGVPVTLAGQSPAPPPLTPAPAPLWPERVFSPYVDATAWPTFDLVGIAQQRHVRFYNLAFVVARAANDATPSWGGYYDVSSGYLLPEINSLRALRGDVMVSFGGAAGTELAVAATSVAQLQAAYQLVIDTYGLTHIDFDIEGAWVAHPASIARRSQAIAGLQAAAAAAGRTLKVWFTLPVLPSGLTLDGRNVIASALQHGVAIDGVNVMAMDYGGSAAPNPQGNMGNYAVAAAQATKAQLALLYQQAGQPQTDAQLWRKIGVTPMIGVNDVATEVFVQADVGVLSSFAQQQGLGMLAFWSMGRDVQCAGGAQPWATYNCSSILQQPFEFTGLFLPYTAPAWQNLGFGLAGANGIPVLTGSGTMQNGGPFALQLANVAPNHACVFVLGASRIDTPLLGFTLVPSPEIPVLAIADAQGHASWSVAWPALPRRVEIWQQGVVLDPVAAQGFAASNGLYAIAP